MAHSKGNIPPVLILIGLVLCIILLMVVFKLFGQWQAFQYEQQAEITARNMQTAMNRVCVTGDPQEIEVNLPQRLSSGGLMKRPTQLAGSIARGDFNAVADGLRYMAALDSYGDPWYIIYYEQFPEGEDSGWLGWSTVASMRTTSTYFRGSEAAICVATSVVPILGDIKKAGSGFAKKFLKAEEASDYIQNSRAFQYLLKNHDDIFLLYKTNPVVGEESWLREVGGKIIAKGRAGYEKSIGKVFNRFYVDLEKPIASPVRNHLIAFREGEKLLGENVEYLGNLNKIYDAEGMGFEAGSKALGKINGLMTDESLSEGAYKAGVKLLSDSSGDLSPLYRTSGDILEGELGIIKAKGALGGRESDYLENLVSRVREGTVSDSEMGLVKRMSQEAGKGWTETDWSTFIDTLENTEGVKRNFEKTGKLSEYLLPDKPLREVTIDGKTLKLGGPQPIDYSRQYLKAFDEKRLSLPALSYARVAGAEEIGRAAGKGIYREGRWVATSYGFAFIFNGLVVSPLEQSQYKFYPCSGNALCLKSAVNPSISVYPLDDCKAAGINYVELDKTPKDAEIGVDVKTASFKGDLSTWGVSTLNSIGSLMVGGKTNSKFYTASPCSGKMEITREVCDCKIDETPYMDPSSYDAFLINCVAADFSDSVEGCSSINLNCRLYRNRTYIGEYGKTEELAKFTAEAGCRYVAEEKRYEVYFDVTDSSKVTFEEGKTWKDYFDESGYYSEIREGLSKKQDTLKEYLVRYGEGEYYEEMQQLMNEFEGEDLGLNCIASLIPESAGQAFSCDPIYLPSVPFAYHTCSDASDIWLKCKKWENLGDATLTKDGFDNKVKVKANEWCCLEWVVSRGSEESEILSVDKCDLYSPKAPAEGVDYNKVKGGLRCTFGLESCPSKSPEQETSEPPTGEAAGEQEPKVTYSPKTIGVTGKEYYVDLASKKIIATIKNSYKITLPKESESGVKLDPNDVSSSSGIGKLYWYNIPFIADAGVAPCLKVRYVASENGKDVTGGFCYTSPTAWSDAKGIGWIVAATAADVGIELAIDSFTAGSGAVTGIGGFASCMAGNLIMWYGEQAVSKEKQKSYWPNNVYFKNYFT